MKRDAGPKIVFQFDEHLDHTLADALRARGIEARTATELHLLSIDDEIVLAVAASARRVIVRRDKDFTRLHAAGQPHAGIVFLTRSDRSMGQIIDALCEVHDFLNPEDMIDRLEYI